LSENACFSIENERKMGGFGGGVPGNDRVCILKLRMKKKKKKKKKKFKKSGKSGVLGVK
jgi:hypothetical protein